MTLITHTNSVRISRTLGEVIVRIWGDLPQDVQHDLFEETIDSLGQSMRPQLAIFLHGKHSRTSNSIIARATLEPDSLGG